MERDLRKSRNSKGLTQSEVALKLGVTQAYISMLEKGERRLSAKQLRALVDLYGLSPTALSLTTRKTRKKVDNKEIAVQLAALGYPGFSYLSKLRPSQNPAKLLMTALTNDNLEARVAEGLPWLVYTYSELNWGWCADQAKAASVTNRLGFILTLARGLAELHGNTTTAAVLSDIEARLKPAVLLRPQTLCRERMTQAERRWLETHRSAQALEWNVLSDISSQSLVHAS